MDKIWAPWRSKYVRMKKQKRCIFCGAYKSQNDKKNYLIFRGEKSFVIMNVFPYNNGHLMVAPVKHEGDLNKLTEKELSDIFALIKKSCKALKKLIKPHAFNIGLNLGREAGAGIVEHLHFHIVPRWRGDTNFMPVACGTKVLPQALNELYEKLKREFGKTAS